MATHRELEAQIRFQLDQLAARNAHHEFEHICRHLTRVRICFNILPATGPVSAGGDQGRDFESYETHIEGPIGFTVFTGLSSTKRLAFACSLQRDNIGAKVKSDIAKIVELPDTFDVVYFLCVTDVPVGKRHELQHWSIEEHNVSLEIHDGQWIAQELCQKDVFWIAQEFLGVPKELYPEILLPEANASYHDLHARWVDNGSPQNFAEFLEVRSGLRQAAAAEGPNQDLRFWMGVLSPDSLPDELRRHAIYEVTIASFRGFKTMEGLEDPLREYYDESHGLVRTSDLEDASVLWGFCSGAFHVACLAISAVELGRWKAQLLERTTVLLEEAQGPGYRAELLRIRGFLLLLPDPSDNSFEFDACLECWEKAVDLAKKAPLLPLGSFADQLTKLIEILPREEQERAMPRLMKLADRMDSLLEERYGAFAAAEKCRDRAMALYNKQDFLGAIEQFHRAKYNWFAEETLRGSILSMLLLSKCYSTLGLKLAGKYYALAGAYSASVAKDLELHRYVPQGLFMAADCDYALGAWCNYLSLATIALMAFNAYGTGSDPSDPENEINATLFHSGIVYAMSRHFAPELRSGIFSKIESWELADDLAEILEAADRQWGGKNSSTIWDALRRERIGLPFADTRALRQVCFSALGLDWEVNWNNSYLGNIAGEHFVASLQILVADLGGRDLCLLPTRISAMLRQGNVKAEEVIAEGSKPGDWSVTLPDPFDADRFAEAVFVAATGLLAHSSVLPMDRTVSLVGECLENGLRGKTFCVESYAKLLAFFVKEDSFHEFERDATVESNVSWPDYPDHLQLAWMDGPGPGYDPTTHRQHIQHRYENLSKRLSNTMKRLASDAAFAATVDSLREEGWKDWHILLATFNAVLNYQASLEMEGTPHTTQIAERAQQLVQLDTLPDVGPIPNAVLSRERLRLHLQTSLLSTLRIWDLRIHTQVPDIGAIQEFLAKRYGYWTDDFEHDGLDF